MTLFESSIYIGLRRLRKLLYKMQFVMDKTNRIVYGTPMMQSLRSAMGWYVRAFEITNKEKRVEYMSECIGEFYNVRIDLDFIMEENMVHFAKHKQEKGLKDVNGNILPMPPLTQGEMDENDRYETNRKVEIYQVVAQIEADIRKYNNSISRGKTLAESKSREANAD